MTGGQFYIVFLFLQWFCFAVDRERRYRAESGERSTYSLYLLSQQWTMMSSVLLGENPYVRVFMCNSKRINNIFRFSKIIEVFLVLIDNHIQCDYTDTWYILPAEEMKTILVFSFFHKVKRYGFDILFPKWGETQSWLLIFGPTTSPWVHMFHLSAVFLLKLWLAVHQNSETTDITANLTAF